MTDLISRSAAMNTLSDVFGIPLDYDGECNEMCDEAFAAIEALPAIDAVPVVHEKDIRSSVITVKDSGEWQDRIILVDESTQVCAVYYADDSELVPVVHARWIDESKEFEGFVIHSCRCSECGKNPLYRRDVDYTQTGTEVNFRYDQSSFCPNCGARMDGESEEDTDGSQTD